MSRSAALLPAILLVMAACSSRGDGHEGFLAEVRGELSQTLGPDAPEYTDEELLGFGERACRNLEDVEDGAALARGLRDAEASSQQELSAIGQATVVVVAAARHLCRDQGERLGLLDGISA